jgi:mono/diheme cytochrome c family protein
VSKFLALLFLVFSFSFSSYAQDVDIAKGKSLFNANCAACHKLNKNLIGPALAGVSAKYEKEWLYTWIKNSNAMIKSGDERAVAIWEEWNKAAMNAFPQLSNMDIDNILAYTDYVPEPVAVAASTVVTSQAPTAGSVSTNIILVVLVIILCVLVSMLFLVNKTLKAIANKNGIEFEKSKPLFKVPIWKLFIKNQFLVFCSVVFFLLSSAYFAYGWMMQIGIDQGYMPVQPIHYSHKIHSGANQIDCQYCHSSARKSKHSGIPSLNVCMNCHENIAEYNGEEDLEKGYTKDFYTNEIKKIIQGCWMG